MYCLGVGRASAEHPHDAETSLKQKPKPNMHTYTREKRARLDRPRRVDQRRNLIQLQKDRTENPVGWGGVGWTGGLIGTTYQTVEGEYRAEVDLLGKRKKQKG